MFGKVVGFLVTHKNHDGLYDKLEWDLKIFQTGAILEVQYLQFRKILMY